MGTSSPPQHNLKPNRCFARSIISRADLLRVLAAEGEQAWLPMAMALGYEYPPEILAEPSNRRTPAPDLSCTATGQPSPPQSQVGHATPSARLFCVTERIPLQPTERQNPFEPPDWFVQARALTCDERPDPASVRLPARLPLTCWPRLWPFLRRVLGQSAPSKQLDIPRVLRRVTQGQALRRLPWRLHHRWSAKLCIVLDYNRHTQPFRQDFNALCQALEAMHGTAGLDIRILCGEPGRQTRHRRPGDDRLQHWRMPDARTPVLILSDLGLLDASAETGQGWRLFGRQLRVGGCQLVVLCPSFVQPLASDLQALFKLYEWDRHSRFQRGGSRFNAVELCRLPSPPTPLPQAGEGSEKLLSPRGERGLTVLQYGSELNSTVLGSRLDQAESMANAVETLLALAAPAIVIEPALLRSLRYLLPARQATAAAEAHIWSHTDITASSQGCCFANRSAITKYQQRFQSLDLGLQHQAVALIRAHHAALPNSLRYAELDVCDRLLPGVVEELARAEVLHWKRNIVKTAGQSTVPALREWQNRHLYRQPYTATLWQDNPELAALWAIAQRWKLEREEVPELPPGVSAAHVWYFLQANAPQTRACALLQRGQQLLLGGGDARGSFFADLSLAGGVFVRQGFDHSRSGLATATGMFEGHCDAQNVTDGVTNPVRQSYIPVAQNITRLAELTQDTVSVELETVTQILRIESLTKPSWAKGIGRDQIGLYAELNIDNIIQRFRWIAPGKFLMGSPQTEAERLEQETQHEVSLAQGYWLADSACTQALWQAVTGNNPSRFKEDANNPVEKVSWNDVRAFIDRLNALVPGLTARLPTEAEWEYACRAGTATAFSFGANITPEQVNYNGNYPYAGAKQGLYREKTVPVKSLPPNPWGLYEMHGNVWEWCQDWFAEYDVAAQTDPTGPVTGALRVLRGGSGNDVGRFVRSALRYGNEPDNRNYNIGFRLALGQTGAGQSAAPRPPGQPQAERRGGQGGRGAAT